jgi:hypothetical protein
MSLSRERQMDVLNALGLSIKLLASGDLLGSVREAQGAQRSMAAVNRLDGQSDRWIAFDDVQGDA